MYSGMFHNTMQRESSAVAYLVREVSGQIIVLPGEVLIIQLG